MDIRDNRRRSTRLNRIPPRGVHPCLRGCWPAGAAGGGAIDRAAGREESSRERLRAGRARVEQLNHWIRQLVTRYPTLRRGGISFYQLRRLLLARARRHNLELTVEVTPWPYAGSLQRIGSSIWIWIDSRRNPADQLYALAHEAGHLLFGHYAVDEEVWTLQDGPGADEWEQEADFFAAFATRTPGTPVEWFTGEQLKLL